MSKPLDPRLVKRVPALLLADAVAMVFHGAGLAAVTNRVVAVIGVAAGRGLLGGVQEWAGQRASVRVRAQVRRLVLDAVVRLGPAWSRRQPPGRLTNTTGPGLDGLDGYVTRAVPALVAASVVPLVALLAITIADWQSGVILAVLLPLVPVFMALVGLTTNRLVQRQYAALERLTGQFLDLLRGLGTLRVYGRAASQQRTLERISDDYRRRTKATLTVAFLSGLVLDLIAALSVAVVAVDIGLRLDHRHVTLATALVVLLLAPELFAPLRAIGTQHHASQEGGEAARAALDIVDEADALPASPPPSAVSVGSGHVTATDLTVRYPGRDTAALEGVSLSLRPGHIVALRGPSGAGKSTVLAVLQGVVRPDTGGVTVSQAGGPRDLTELDPDAWRAAVAWLPQRPRPTQPTVADEVRLGCPEADDDTVALACRLAAAPDPATPLAEDGLGVSAGQRRRIALARILVRAWGVCARGDVPLVLLDEPSEDLDRETETVVAAVIDDLRDWATVVIATHSDVLADQADELIVMADGRVVRHDWQRPAPVAAIVDVLPDTVAAPPITVAQRSAVPAPLRLRELVRAAGATKLLLGAVALSAAAALTGLGLTSTSLWLIARAAQHPNVQALALAVVGVRTFAIGRAVLRYAERLLTHDVALRMLSALRARVFAGLRTLSPSALSAHGRGDLLRRFVGDVDGAQEGLVRAAVPAGGAIAGAAGGIALAAALDLRAGAVLAAGLLLAVALGPLAGRLAGDASEVVRLAGARDRRVAGLVDGLDELVAYGRAEREVATVAEADADVARAAARPALAAAAGTAASGIVSATTLGLVLAAAASAATAGRLGVVEVGVLVVCLLTGFEAVSALPAALVAWRRCRAGLSRVAEVAARDAAPRPGTTPAPDGPTGLRARQLTLTPAVDAPAVLHDAGLDVVAGRRVAVVGPSGCGKSTLLGAAVGQLPVAAGRLDVTGERPDGGCHAVALGEVTDRAAVIAGSLQGDHVFDATLRDNVRLVRPDASDAELDAVAERVRLLDVVRSLPRGWDTPAGADGSALSGGQRQRLLLARALLANPQILVLDEPTAHLDGATEAALLADLLDATAGRTVLLSSHRRLPAGGIDSLLSMQDGTLVEVGSTTSSVAPDRPVP